jgi:hypothetical protein
MADFRLERARRSYRSRRASSDALSCRIIASFSSPSSGLQLITLSNISASEVGSKALDPIDQPHEPNRMFEDRERLVIGIAEPLSDQRVGRALG